MIDSTKPAGASVKMAEWKENKFLVGVVALALAGVLVAGSFGYVAMTSAKPRFVEGVHYKILDRPYSTQVGQLDDYYWLNCDSCFMFEGLLKSWSKDNSKFSFNKIHATSNDLWLDDAKLDTSLRSIGRPDLVDAFFAMAIKNKGFTKNRGEINTFLAGRSVDTNKFWLEYSSPASLAKALDRADNSDKVGIRVVPTFVLDGKYKILLGALKNNNELIDIVEFLELNHPVTKSNGEN